MATVDQLIGTWLMFHDGASGLLTISEAEAEVVTNEGTCTFRTTPVTGSWTDAAGNSWKVEGNFQGKDDRSHGDCPWSEHLVTFAIAFPTAAPQEFEGYLFLQDPATMAGLTRAESVPLGWYAVKPS